MKWVDRKGIGNEISRWKELDKLVASWEIRIKPDWTAYSTSWSHRKDAVVLNDRIRNLAWGEMIRSPAISRAFMNNFNHNLKLLEGKTSSMIDYDCRNVIKPLEIIKDVQEWWAEIDEWRKEPATLAGICHKLRCSRRRLGEMLKNRGYDGAAVLIQNVLLKYAENYLFTGKNVAWAQFYLKNLYPEIYQDKMTTETNVKISLVDLSKKADKMEFNMKKMHAIKWEIVEAPKMWRDRLEERIKEEKRAKAEEFEEIEEEVWNGELS